MLGGLRVTKNVIRGSTIAWTQQLKKEGKLLESTGNGSKEIMLMTMGKIFGTWIKKSVGTLPHQKQD